EAEGLFSELDPWRVRRGTAAEDLRVWQVQIVVQSLQLAELYRRARIHLWTTEPGIEDRSDSGFLRESERWGTRLKSQACPARSCAGAISAVQTREAGGSTDSLDGSDLVEDHPERGFALGCQDHRIRQHQSSVSARGVEWE